MTATRALLLTDVVDSTTLAESLGDARMAELWAAHDRVARDLLRVHGGREIDKTDGFLLLFDDVRAALAYAVAYHRGILALDPPLRARAGVHFGDVILTENRADDVALGAKPLEVDGLAKPLAARVMGLALGGQTLMTGSAVEALGSTSLRVVAHGHWRMKGVEDPVALFEAGDDDAPFTPPPDGGKVYRVIRDGDLWLPARAIRHSLPAERDAFVGREADLQALARTLDGGARLVSVLGIGGTGKTRLVTRFAWTWLGDFPGGVWFCDLSEARDIDGITAAVAGALEVPLGAADPIVQLGHAIAGRGRCLVILDNVEQVARYARETLGRWLDRSPEARFITTTREVLGLAGEATLALAPLGPTASRALFVVRAVQARHDFTLSEADTMAVEALVALLDGLPLAIELAAARVRVMPPAVLLARMSERFRLLSSSGGRHTRQATLRGALDWSWDLLSPDEQTALGQLAVFEGGFTLEAAEAVLALADAWSPDAVQALVDKSLVRRAAEDRFDLLVSVQEYAAEKLEASGHHAAAEARHGLHFASMGSDAALEAVKRSPTRRRALVTDLDNLLAACRRGTARGETRVAVRAMRAANLALRLRGPLSVSVALATAVVELPLGPSDRAIALLALGDALVGLGRVDEAAAKFEASSEAAREAQDHGIEAMAQQFLGNLRREQGRHDEALAHSAATLEAARAAGDRRIEGMEIHNLGLLYRDQGRLAEARNHFDAALAMLQGVGDARQEAFVQSNLAILANLQGRIDDARSAFESALVMALDLGDRRLEAVLHGNLGNLLRDTGDLDAAVSHYQRALTLATEFGERRGVGIHTGNLGNVYRLRGEAAAGRRHLEAALALHVAIGFTYGQPYWMCGLALLDVAEGELARALAGALAAREVAAPFLHVQIEALCTLARVHVARGEADLARSALTRARALGDPGRLGALLAAVEAQTACAKGEADASEAALIRATADPDLCRAGTEVAAVVHATREALRTR